MDEVLSAEVVFIDSCFDDFSWEILEDTSGLLTTVFGLIKVKISA